MAQITAKQRDTMAGQVVASSTNLLEVKKELMSAYKSSDPRLASAIGKAMKACEAVNALLRSIGYLLEEPDKEPGQVKISSLEESNND